MKRKIYVNKSRSFEEAAQWDVRFWKRAGAEARFAAAWSMVGDFLKMRGKSGGQPRLRRTVQILKHV